MLEQWKPVSGYGQYEISSLGRVRRIGSLRSLHRRRKTGYAAVRLSQDGIERDFRVHILVAAAFMPPKPSPAHEVNHINGIKSDPSLQNLEWVTRKQNVIHAYRTGLKRPSKTTGPREMNGNAKISQFVVQTIRELRGRGVKLRKIARLFGISESLVSTVARGLRWSEEAA